jgi:hypothetical protein
LKTSLRVYQLLAIGTLILSACAPPATTTPQPASSRAGADLQGIKAYLNGKGAELKESTAGLKSASDRYYSLAQNAGFDYAALWSTQPDEARQAIEAARRAWIAASPLYEQMEGIVAGTPSLAEYDLILDAGASGQEDPQNAVPFDLTLPDGRVLPKPGNLFGVTESALWGTFEDYGSGVPADWDGDGSLEFAETLPDAGVLKAASDALDDYTTRMLAAISAWEPSETDAFTALVVMVPTMSEYFDSWKNSRFVMGEESGQRDFVVISRLSDIQDILSSLQVVYTGVSPLIESEDPALSARIEQDLAELKDFVAGVYSEEQQGKNYTPEEADILGAETQNRATAIAGQISQVAARLNIEIAE